MSRRAEIYILVGLGIVLIAVLYYTTRRQASVGSEALAANVKFQPLDVREPHLRIDLLARLQKIEYTGSHRNIFVAAPPPPPQAPGQTRKDESPFVGPRRPPPPPPLQVPAEFFGYAIRRDSGKRVAFFTSGDDVLVVPEGDTFLGRFRLDRIGNDSAEVEEMSTGRRATVPMVQPPAEQAGAQ
jgi:hypothetical protein